MIRMLATITGFQWVRSSGQLAPVGAMHPVTTIRFGSAVLMLILAVAIAAALFLLRTRGARRHLMNFGGSGALRLINAALFLLAMVILGTATGCTANGQPAVSCDQIRATYAKADAAVTATGNTVLKQQAIVDALPPDSATRQALAKPLAEAITAAQEAQVWANLARAAVATFCPELPQPNPTTQPATSPARLSPSTQPTN